MAEKVEHIRFLERGSLDANVRRPAFPHTWRNTGKIARPARSPDASATRHRHHQQGAASREAIAGSASGCGWSRSRRPAPTWSTSSRLRARGITVSNIRNYAVNTVPGAHLRADPGAAPQHPGLPRGRRSAADGARRRSSATSTTRSAISPARRWASSATACSGKAVAELGEAFGMRVLFSDYKGATGMGPLYTPVRGGAADERRDHAAHAAAALDPQPDRRAPSSPPMERRPLLINTARGGLVDEEALVDGAAQRADRRGRLRRGDDRAAAAPTIR